MTDALAHLRAFRATFNDDDQVDEESGLTAHDLDEAIEAMVQASKMVAIRYVDLNQPGGWDALKAE